MAEHMILYINTTEQIFLINARYIKKFSKVISIYKYLFNIFKHADIESCKILFLINE